MRIRTIKPEFWTHEGLSQLPEFTRLLAIALLNLADDEGYFLASPALIRGAVFPFLEDSRSIPVALRELSILGYLRLAKAKDGREVGHIVKFTAHQQINKPRASKIKASATFPEDSRSPPVVVRESSREEWNGMEKEHGREGPPPIVPQGTNGCEQLTLAAEIPPSSPPPAPLTPDQIEVGSWFGRRPTTQWTAKELKAWHSIPADSLREGIPLLGPLYRRKAPYLRRDLQTLLNNWQGEIDRAKQPPTTTASTHDNHSTNARGSANLPGRYA